MRSIGMFQKIVIQRPVDLEITMYLPFNIQTANKQKIYSRPLFLKWLMNSLTPIATSLLLTFPPLLLQDEFNSIEKPHVRRFPWRS